MRAVQIIETTPMTGNTLNPSLNVKLHEARIALTRVASTPESEMLTERLERMRSQTRQLPLRFRIQQSLAS